MAKRRLVKCFCKSFVTISAQIQHHFVLKGQKSLKSSWKDALQKDFRLSHMTRHRLCPIIHKLICRPNLWHKIRYLPADEVFEDNHSSISIFLIPYSSSSVSFRSSSRSTVTDLIFASSPISRSSCGQASSSCGYSSIVGS